MDLACRSPGALIELEQDPALAELVRDWDFSPGKKFQAEVLRKFSSLGSSHFFLAGWFLLLARGFSEISLSAH
jgi:hypothetical protein